MSLVGVSAIDQPLSDLSSLSNGLPLAYSGKYKRYSAGTWTVFIALAPLPDRRKT